MRRGSFRRSTVIVVLPLVVWDGRRPGPSRRAPGARARFYGAGLNCAKPGVGVRGVGDGHAKRWYAISQALDDARRAMRTRTDGIDDQLQLVVREMLAYIVGHARVFGP